MKQIINIEKIVEFMFKNNMNEKGFCDFCMVPYPLVSRMIFNDYDFSLKYLLQIAEKMNIDICHLFK